MTRRSRPLLVVGALALVSACGGSTTESTTPAAAPASATAAADGEGEAPAPPAAGEVPEILQFTSVDLTGAPVDGAGYAGKPVAFWFWAPG